MTKSSLATALILASLTSSAWADGKCGNGGGHRLFQFGSELVIPWAVPVPANAKVRFTDGKTIDAVSPNSGPGAVPEFPKKYTTDSKRVEVFNSSMAWSVSQLLDIEKRFGIEMSRDAIAVFEKYASTRHDFVVALVQHPPFSGSQDLTAHCSVVLQQGVIEFADGKQTLHLRSYFYSANKSGGAVNFVPGNAVEITFETGEIWFPLSLTKLIGEPSSYVLLDIVTPEPMKSTNWGRGFQVTESKKITLNGKTAYVTHGSAKFDAGKDLDDLRLKP